MLEMDTAIVKIPKRVLGLVLHHSVQGTCSNSLVNAIKQEGKFGSKHMAVLQTLMIPKLCQVC